MTLNELVIEVHEEAKQKGWHENPRSPLELHMLIVSEVAEATEECRNGSKPIYINPSNGKPEGEAIELADAVIRIMDYFGLREWDLEEAMRLKIDYNKQRSYRHGNKLY